MSLNRVVLNGSLPHFEGTYKVGVEGKQSYLRWALSVKRNFKKKDEQYYPQDLITFKAFGAKADFIMNNFAAGDGLIIEGSLQRDDDYEKEGEKQQGQLYVLIESVMYADAKKEQGSSQSKPNNSKSIPQSGLPKSPSMPPKPPFSSSIPSPFGK